MPGPAYRNYIPQNAAVQMAVSGPLRLEFPRTAVKLLRGELIGLIPLDAVLQVAADSLKLEGFTRDRVIESHFLE